MEIIIKNIKSSSDRLLFTSLAKRLGLKAEILTLEEKEDIGLGKAMKKAEKGKYFSKKEAEKYLGDD